jgi:hypothetical protein
MLLLEDPVQAMISALAASNDPKAKIFFID